MKKKQKKIIFIQDCGIYSNQIVVAVNVEKKNIIAWFKKQKDIKKEGLEWIEKEERAFEIFKQNNALVVHNDGKLLLLLRPVEDCWDYWECLLHELNHIVWYVAKNKMFQEEMEAQAYLQEYLFHEIRRKLVGVDKI